MLEDTILIWKFNRGSADALRTIYEKYRGTMLTIATALCNDVHLAEDIVQDCFVAFAKKGRQLKLAGSLKAYMTASVVNRIRDRRRVAKHQPAEVQQPERLQSFGYDPQKSAILDEQTRMLSTALAGISSEMREVVVLYTRGRMTYKEIAKLQNVSIPTVQRRYRSGIDKLKVLLDGEVES